MSILGEIWAAAVRIWAAAVRNLGRRRPHVRRRMTGMPRVTLDPDLFRIFPKEFSHA